MVGQRFGGGKAHLVGNGAARTSSAPRKMPGKPSELLTWLGKSERPVATTTRSGRFRLPGPDFGYRVGAGEDDSVFGHALDPFRQNNAWAWFREGNDDIGPHHGFGNAAFHGLRHW
jgi:hypothetical protein